MADWPLISFRGFAGYWEVPFGQPTAEHGQWVKGPGADFFKTVSSALSGADGRVAAERRIETERSRSAVKDELPIIAEDLGLITPDVIELRDEFNLPGMRIFQFGFDKAENPFLPHNYVSNCVAYTGTHDNDTARGWLESAPQHEREYAFRYLNTDPNRFVWDLIRGIWSSVAVYSITTMQDLLNLGTSARMNFPSKLGGNWEWRMREKDMNEELARSLKELNEIFLR